MEFLCPIHWDAIVELLCISNIRVLISFLQVEFITILSANGISILGINIFDYIKEKVFYMYMKQHQYNC